MARKKGESKRDELRNKVFWATTALHSLLSTCDRLNTAASAEKDKRLVGLGYNGSLPGQPHCDEVGHLMVEGHCERTLHCEDNLDLNTLREKMKGARVRVIGSPCIRCMKRNLVATGVAEVRYASSKNQTTGLRGKDLIDELASQAGIDLRPEEIDWTELFQELLDLMAKPGGILYREGYRLKVTKESLSK